MTEQLSEKQIIALRGSLLRYGRVRFPLLHAEVDDLAAQTVGDLWTYLQNRDGGTPFGEVDVQRIAYAIFNRRAADLYRKRSNELAPGLDDTAFDELVDEHAAEPEQMALHRRMLHICADELTRLGPEDRMAVAIATGLANAAGDTLSPAERQRLHRVRKRLAAAIRRELGDDVLQLLGDIP